MDARTTSVFGLAVAVGDSRGAIAFDRTTMVFFSNRPGGFGDDDLYIVTRN
jgi:hypothetical protein